MTTIIEGYTTYTIQVFEPLNIPLVHVSGYGYPSSYIPDTPLRGEYQANYRKYMEWHKGGEYGLS
jgi:hypothetical protein